VTIENTAALAQQLGHGGITTRSPQNQDAEKYENIDDEGDLVEGAGCGSAAALPPVAHKPPTKGLKIPLTPIKTHEIP
jgi:hypothetical protein